MHTQKLTRNGFLAGVVAMMIAIWGGLAWAAGGEVDEQPLETPVIEEVQAVIESQLLAFQTSDGPGAFYHAAPSIQGAFGDSKNFMAMVKRGYRVIYDNRRWTFEDSRINGDNAAQIVLVEDATGQQVRAVYFLGRMQGRWQITGVQQIETISAGA